MEEVRRDNGGFEISRVLSRAFDAAGTNLGLSLILALPLVGIPSLLMHWWLAQNGFGTDYEALFAATGSGDFWKPMAMVWIVWVATDAVLQTALVHATVLTLTGKTAGFAESFELGFTRLLPVVAINLIMTVSIMFAGLFFIVPGVILAICWWVAVPAYVEERTGIIGSLSRSLALTEGEWGKIFLIALIVGVGSWLVGYAVGLFGELLGSGGSALLPALIEGCLAAATRIVWVTMGATAYVELRTAKEGAAPSELETVFS